MSSRVSIGTSSVGAMPLKQAGTCVCMGGGGGGRGEGHGEKLEKEREREGEKRYLIGAYCTARSPNRDDIIHMMQDGLSQQQKCVVYKHILRETCVYPRWGVAE